MSVVIRFDLLPFFLSLGLSTFTDIKGMPPTLKEKREELWQLEEHSPFPDEVEIVVFEEHPPKGYIRPKGNLNTPFTMENIIEVSPMFSIVYFKKFVSKGICIGIYKTAIYSKKDFTNTPEQIYF